MARASVAALAPASAAGSSCMAQRRPRSLDLHARKLDPGVVVVEDVAVAVATLRHAVGAHLAESHPMSPAPAAEEPTRRLARRREALGGEPGGGDVERPAHGQPSPPARPAAVSRDADLAHAAGRTALQDLEAAEAEAGEAGGDR